ncbi:MAG: endo alpha-1,4 polygalactosaminidase [Acidobacteriota bacterium]
MSMRIVIGILTTFLAAVVWAEAGTWAVYYSDEAPVEAFRPYRLLVLDSEHHPNLQRLADRGKTLLGYLSLGEVERTRPHFRELKADALLLAENPNWEGSYFIDLRDPRWTARVVEDLIPEILRQGFHGLFLDTLDNAAHLERINPRKFKGMTLAAAVLVRTIRRHYPHTKIMLNRGYEILPLVKKEVDMVLGESVYSDYSFEKKAYQLVPDDLFRQQVELLKETKRSRPQIRVFTLDYWNPTDSAMLEKIYRVERANGFEPYVATVELDRLVREPGK